MKLWSSFLKELKIASRGFYFYVELFMAFILLFILIFVLPENFNNRTTEYLFINLPSPFDAIVLQKIRDQAGDTVKPIETELKIGKQVIKTQMLETESETIYLVSDESDLRLLADKGKNTGIMISLTREGKIRYTYYIQGYESERMKNLYRVFNNSDMVKLNSVFKTQDARALHEKIARLTDRQNMIPPFLTFNGSLMGLFIIAAYIFLDKKEGVIKAYAVTPSSIWHYLLSKVGIIITTSVFTSLIIMFPVVKFNAHYLLFFLFLLTSGFFSSALGLLLSSFYKNIMQAFGAIFVLIIIFILPNFAYFIPGWDPPWIHYLPSYPMLQSFKEILLKNINTGYVVSTSLLFLGLGLILFLLSVIRFKKTLNF